MHTITPKQDATFKRFFPPARFAIAALFFINGVTVGSWAPKIPEFAARLGLTETELGLMIVAFGIGSLIAMPLVGAIIAKSSSRPILRGLTLATACSLPVITLAPGIPTATIAIIFLGAAIGGMDVAMNANAVALEKQMGRAIMSSCHGFWSLGGLVGAASGGALIAAFGTLNHALIVSFSTLVLAALAWTKVHNDTAAADAVRQPLALPRTMLPWLIGFMAFACMVPEGAVLDWGALYLRQELGATLTTSGYAFAAFSATMALMRFAGDMIRDRLGAVATLRLGAAIAAAGLLIAGIATSPLTATLGYALAGIGIANLVPIAFSAAGNLPGLAPGIGLSLVTFLGYSGVLVAPTLLGFVGERTGFAAVFTALPALFVFVLAISHHGRHADAASR